MRRRVVLGSLVGLGVTTGVAGCLSRSGGDDDGDSDSANGSVGDEDDADAGEDDAPSDEDDETARTWADTVSVGDYEEAFETSAGRLAFAVDVDDPELAAEHPARLTVEVTNESPDDVTIETGHRAVFSAIRDRDETTFLLSVGRDVEDEAPDVECPMLIDRPTAPDETRSVELASGESRQDRLSLWVDFDGLNGRCPEPGTVEFQNAVLVQGNGGSDADQWGFDLQLE